jgi:hypothetical protein
MRLRGLTVSQAAAQSDEVLHGGAQLSRTLGDTARLDHEDCLGVVERQQGLESPAL